MSYFEYYLTWLAAGLVIIAVISGVLAWQTRRRVVRRLETIRMKDTLGAYSEWLSAQRRTAFFQGEPSGQASLHHIAAVTQQFIPELQADVQVLGAVHQRMVEFLQTQQDLRIADPEAWLESGHDTRFLELWHQHLMAVQTLAHHLDAIAVDPDTAAPRGKTFAA